MCALNAGGNAASGSLRLRGGCDLPKRGAVLPTRGHSQPSATSQTVDYIGAMREPFVLVITGLPGTGKSTLRDELAKKTGTPAFSGDWLLGSLHPARRVLATLTRDEQGDLYRSLLESLVVRQLTLEQSAIVDAVVTDEIVSGWAAVASDHGAMMHVIECICSDIDLHRSRVQGRIRGIPGWHEIGWEHVEFMRAERAPLTSERLVLDAINPLADDLARAADLIPH